MKNINKLIISGVGMFLMLLPLKANAATLSLDNANRTNDKGVLRFPLILTVNEEEAPIQNIDVECDCGGDLDATCEFEKKDGSYVVLRDKLFGYYEDANKTTFPAGKTEIGYLVIKNNLASSRSITFSVTSKAVTSEIVKNTINITPKEVEKPKSNDATLSSLKVSQGTMTPEFNKDVTEYTIYGISDTINSVNLTYECGASGCSVNPSAPAGINGRKINLNQGTNKVEVSVTSEDESSTKVYVLNILRGDTGYNSSKLSNLSFGEYNLTPAFKKDVTEYTLMIPNSMTSVISVLKFEKEDVNAKETLNGFDNFVIGENTATITIDNVNGDETTTYKIVITRMADTDIEVLKYKNNQVTFRDSEGIQNTLAEEEFEKQYEEEWKKIQNGTYKFDDDGNLITGEEKDTDKKEEAKKNNTWIIIALIVGGLTIIGVSGYFIFKKKKPDTQDDSENKLDSETTNEDLDKTMEIDESNIEEELVSQKNEEKENDTMEIDEALVDLMSTKKYDFKDEE